MTESGDIEELKRRLALAESRTAELQAAELALSAREEKYHALFHTIDEGFCIMELELNDRGEIAELYLREINDSFVRQTGLEGIVGRTVHEVLPNFARGWIDIYSQVAKTGKSYRTENYVQDVDRWYDTRFSLVGEVGSKFVAVVFQDVTGRHKDQEALRESEKRQAFLLRFSDALRAEPDADAVANRAMRMLADEMRLDRCYIALFRFVDDRGEHPYQVGNDRVPPLPETVRLSDYPERIQTVLDRSLVVNDLMEIEGLSDTDKRNFGALGLRAFAAAILHKAENQPLWTLNAVSASPRRWTSSEVILMEEAAERTWTAMERARIVAEVRESEEQHRAELTRQVQERTAELQQSRDLLQATMDSSEDMIQVFEAVRDEHGSIIDFNWVLNNHTSESKYGEVRGQSLLERNPGVVQEGIFDAFKQVTETGVPIAAERHYVHEEFDGWFYQSAVKLNDGVATTTKDITAWKKSQEEVLRLRDEVAQALLRESEQNLHGVANIVPDLLWYSEPDGSTPWYNDRWLEYTGQTLEQATGWGWVDAIHPDDREGSARRYHEAVEQSKPLQQEHRIRSASGEYRWFLVRAEPPRDAQGRVTRIYGAATDIHDQRLAMEALRESEEQYRYLFETMRQGYIENELIRDADGRAVDYRTKTVNPQFERLTGISAGEAVGRTARELVGELDPVWIETYDRVVRTGEPEQFEREETALGRWFEVQAFPLTGDRFAILYDDITERRRTDAALRESEERQSFLLRLSDALRTLSDPEAIQGEAMRLLGEKLGVNRAQYYTADETGEYLSSSGGYTDGVPAAVGRFRLIEFGKYAYDGFHAGETQVVCNATTDPRISKTVLRSYETVGFLAYIGVPFVRRGRFLGTVAVHQSGPRQWTNSERMMVEETAERAGIAIEQARAEAALRESEERFRQFANASSDLLWIRDAASLDMEFVSPAFHAIYGISPEAVLGDLRKWAALIIPDDREMAVTAVERVRAGEAVVHEFRVRRPDDGVFRWIRNTDFPLRDERDRVIRIAGIGHDVTVEKLSAEHQAVLLAELQHRVRNIMAMIRSMVLRTQRTAQDVPDYAALMSGRVMSMARTQALLTRAANVGVELGAMIQAELEAQADETHYSLAGSPVEISPKAAEVLSLAIHELATNALKYGALAVAEGHVAVSWSVADEQERKWLKLFWTEDRPPVADWTPPTRKGFGTELVERRVSYELDGRAIVEVTPQGAQVLIEFPLGPGASVLETGAPVRKSVYGGSIDMTGEPPLTGQSILILEDDYMQASDLEQAVRSVGAEVLGPFSRERYAIVAQRIASVSAAIIDINLGNGASFETAHVLKSAGVPFLFLTGYDHSEIPVEFESIPRFVKPMEPRQVVREVARLLAGRLASAV